MSEIKNIDQKGIDFLIHEEGIRLVPYLDSAGIATIGIGATYYEDGTKVTMKDHAITRDRALSFFKNILKHYELTVYSVTRDDITQNQFNALTSLCYNIGTHAFKRSTLVQRVNQNPMGTDIKDAFMMWKKPPELIARRQREIQLYFS
jgi:lysozyme